MLVFLSLLVSFSACLVTTALQCGEEDIKMTHQTITRDGDAYIMAGRLLVCVNNKWATVCQRGWDDVDARVACRELGLDYASSK